MKVEKKLVLKIILNYIVALLIAVFSLIFIDSLSTEIAENKIKSAIKLNQISSEDYKILKYGRIEITEIDNFSNCVVLGQIFSQSSLPFAQRPTASTTGAQTVNACQDFIKSLDSQENWITYSRFYHGASAIIKLLLQVATYHQIMSLVTLIILFTIILISYIAYKNSQIFGWSVLIYFFMISDELYQGLSLTHGLSSLIGLVSVLLIWIFIERKPLALYSIVSITAMLYAVIAHLYTPMEYVILATLGIKFSKKSNKENLVIKISIIWILSYLGAMIFRFLWSGFILGQSVSAGEAEFSFNSRFTNSISELILSFFKLGTQLLLTYPIRTCGVLFLVALNFLFIGKGGQKISKLIKKNFFYLFPSILAFSWLLFMAGHNGHPWVYRVPATILLNILTTLSVKPGVQSEQKSG